MQEHIIKNYKGTPISWSKNSNNEDFCLLYNDNNGKYTFTPNENLNCQLYMFGGGGAGGYFFGGGGGAGAAYINKNYTFEKNKTYTFEIGTGGKCDIDNINLLFTPGIQLKVFNNTSPTLNNFSFIGEDYSNINIDNNSARTYIVQDLTIDPSLFNKNTTYIWEGYIKGNTDKNYNFSIVSNLKTFIWIQDYENDDMSSLNVFNSKSTDNTALLVGGYNFNQHPFSKQLKSNIFYKIKIIAYNDNESLNNFNIKLDSNCDIYNFNRENENYKYIKSSDTILTYNNDDGTFGSIKCIGGGNGGCGLYNQDISYLNGGCGGGSGLNKIKGLSKIQPIYNGFDGAIGTYCGGGGGIMSAGNNANGGDGLILNWFNDTLIFGAGGNAAGNNKTRNMGYGCGGNGGTCCYYTKKPINNNGNNGCILIYVKPESFKTFEGFTTNLNNNLSYDKGATPIFTDSSKLYNLLNNTATLNDIDITYERSKYFNTNQYAMLSDNRGDDSTDNTILDFPKFNNEMYINDLLVIFKLYTTVYLLLKQLSIDLSTYELYSFLDNFKINIAAADTLASISNASKIITLSNKWYEATTLNLSNDTAHELNGTTDEKAALYGIATDTFNDNFFTTEKISYFHNYNNDNLKIPAIANLVTEAITNNNWLKYSASSYPHIISLANAGSADIAANAVTTYNFEDLVNELKTLILAVYTAASNLDVAVKATGGGNTSATGYHDNYGYGKTAVGIIPSADTTTGLTGVQTLKSTYDDYMTAIDGAKSTLDIITSSETSFNRLKTIFDTFKTKGNNIADVAIKFPPVSSYTGKTAAVGAGGGPVLNGAVGTSIFGSEISAYTGARDAVEAFFNTTPTGDTTDYANKNAHTTLNLNVYDSSYITKNSIKTAINNYKKNITNSSSYADYRAILYLNAFNIILNTSKESILPILNYYRFYYNILIYNIAIQNEYFKIQKKILQNNKEDIIYSADFDETPSVPSATAQDSITSDCNTLNNAINILNTLMNKMADNIYTISPNVNIKKNTLTLLSNVKNIKDTFNINQNKLNSIINKYNNYLLMYNNILLYYKIIIAFAIFLGIVIILIFSSSLIDNNSKISIFIIISIFIVILLFLYNNNITIENFTIAGFQKKTSGDSTKCPASSINFETYKNSIMFFTGKLLLYIDNSDTSIFNKDINAYMSSLTLDKKRKAEFYKIKYTTLENNIEIMKKSINYYYYLIVFIASLIIILMIGLILYLSFPQLLLQIVVLCVILLIISVYYFTYKMHRTTRIYENKNYWANYNPSRNTLDNM